MKISKHTLFEGVQEVFFTIIIYSIFVVLRRLYGAIIQQYY